MDKEYHVSEWFWINGPDVGRIRKVMKRLYSEEKLSGDEMRNLAQDLDLAIGSLISDPDWEVVEPD